MIVHEVQTSKKMNTQGREIQWEGGGKVSVGQMVVVENHRSRTETGCMVGH